MARETSGPDPRQNPDAGVARPGGGSLDSSRTDNLRLPVVVKPFAMPETPPPAQSESGGRIDVRPKLVASGVPASLIDGLNDHGVYTGYLEQVDALSDAASDPLTESSVLLQKAGSLPHYDEYVVDKIRSHFAAEGLEGDELEDQVDGVSEVLLGPDVPADEISEALSPAIAAAHEDSPSPLMVIGAFRQSADTLGNLFGTPWERGAQTPQADAANADPNEPTEVVRVVFNEKVDDPEGVAALYERPPVRALLARHHLADHIIEARGGDPKAGDTNGRAMEAALGFVPSDVVGNRGGTGELFAPLRDGDGSQYAADSQPGTAPVFEKGRIVLMRRNPIHPAAPIFDPAEVANEALRVGQELSDKTEK